jgi:hypothetical protein
MTNFTPLAALLGGALIGAAAVLLLASNGRIAGVSGIFGALPFAPAGQRAWRVLFVVGLIAGTGVYIALGGAVPAPRAQFPAWLLVAAGLLVGYGTSLAHGCTSGHGVCGLARFSIRSAAATGTFLGVAIVTTFIVRHVLGGPG